MQNFKEHIGENIIPDMTKFCNSLKHIFQIVCPFFHFRFTVTDMLLFVLASLSPLHSYYRYKMIKYRLHTQKLHRAVTACCTFRPDTGMIS